MPAPVSSIRNLGPVMDAAFARAGIRSAEEVRALGADEAYRRLVEAGRRPHFTGYRALVMGLQGRPWNDADGPEKDMLRRRFDAIRAGAAAAPLAGMEAALDEIGVIPARESAPPEAARRQAGGGRGKRSGGREA